MNLLLSNKNNFPPASYDLVHLQLATTGHDMTCQTADNFTYKKIRHKNRRVTLLRYLTQNMKKLIGLYTCTVCILHNNNAFRMFT